jgi:ATP-dependent Lon protease
MLFFHQIDKLGRGYNGDPGSALLELLDRSNNNSFVDHYLDVPIDFSNVLFICTANDESAISGPLRDRMDIIRISGYDIPEKVAIAKKYLLPKSLLNAGLAREEVSINVTDDALDLLVRQYCRESGVRNLERHIDTMTRKMAFKLVMENEEYQVQHDDLETPQPDPLAAYIIEMGNELKSNISGRASFRGVQKFLEQMSPDNDQNSSYTALSNPAESSAPSATNVIRAMHLKPIEIVVNNSNLKEYVGQPIFSQVFL